MRRRRQTLQVSTFPFLAVLLCAMGSLILLLLVIDRRAKAVARAKVVQAALKARAEANRMTSEHQAELERRRRELHDALLLQEQELLGQLRTVQGKVEATTRDVSIRRAGLQQLQSRYETEASRLAREQALLASCRDKVTQKDKLTKASREELKRMAADLAKLEQTLAELKALRKNEQPLYSVVPYKGKRGDNRKPIYLECTTSGLIFHPDRLALGPLSTSVDIRSEVERRIAAQRPTPSVKANENAYMMMLVRPDGLVTYYQALAALDGLKIDFGYEFVESDWVFDFPSSDTEMHPQPWMSASPQPPPVKAAAPATPPQPLGRRLEGVNFNAQGPGDPARGGGGGGVGSAAGGASGLAPGASEGSRRGPPGGYGTGNAGSGGPSGINSGMSSGGSTASTTSGGSTGPGGVPGGFNSGTGTGTGSSSGEPAVTGHSGLGLGGGSRNGTGNGSSVFGGQSGTGDSGVGTGGGTGSTARAGQAGIGGSGIGSGGTFSNGTGSALGGGRGTGVPGVFPGGSGAGPGPATLGGPVGSGSSGRANSGGGFHSAANAAGSGLGSNGGSTMVGRAAGSSGSGAGSAPGTGQANVGPGDALTPSGGGGAPHGQQPSGAGGTASMNQNSGMMGNPGAGQTPGAMGTPGAGQNMALGGGQGAGGGGSPGMAGGATGQKQTPTIMVGTPQKSDERRLVPPPTTPEAPQVRPAIIGGGSSSSGGTAATSSGGAGHSGGHEGADPVAERMPSMPRTPSDRPPPTPNVRPGLLAGNRDWIIPVECTTDSVIIHGTGQKIPLDQLNRSADNPLAKSVKQLIDRRQGSLPADVPPYRPIIRFVVRPNASRAYFLAYPALEKLRLPMSRVNLEPEDELVPRRFDR